MRRDDARVRGSVVLAILAMAMVVGLSVAAPASAKPLHQYGGCPAGSYYDGFQCMPNYGGYPGGGYSAPPAGYPGGNQFGCPSGSFYNGANCSPTRYDSYPGACPEGYYFDGYACTYADANRPGPAVTPTPLPPAPRQYARPLPPAPPHVVPPPARRASHVRQTLPFTGTGTVKLVAAGLTLVLGGLLLLSARSVAGARRA
jgi:hypothetical protein